MRAAFQLVLERRPRFRFLRQSCLSSLVLSTVILGDRDGKMADLVQIDLVRSTTLTSSSSSRVILKPIDQLIELLFARSDVHAG